jgi:hypothetical protein
MNRVLLVAILMAAEAALAPAGSAATFAGELPVPPIPPERSSFGETAPVPNLDATAPPGTAPEAASLEVKMFRAQPYDPGLGFAPGSRYLSAEDRKVIQTPGLNINVPLK